METGCLERTEVLIINGRGDGVWKCHLDEETVVPGFSATKIFGS